MFIYIALAFVLGLLARPYLDRHKHSYEVLLHSNLNENGFENIPVSYTVTDAERAAGYKLKRSATVVTYKRCTKCKQCSISFHSGNRDFQFDYDVVKTMLDKHLQSEKEKEDQKLMDKVNERIGLTSVQTPYNPAHGNQATPQ